MPIYEYDCDECHYRDLTYRVEVITYEDPDKPMFCSCSSPMQLVLHAASIRFTGKASGRNYTVASPARTRMRKEISDAYTNGELKRGESPFNSTPDKPKDPHLNDFYGKGSEQPIVNAVKNIGERSEQIVRLPSNEVVKIKRKNKTDFNISKV